MSRPQRNDDDATEGADTLGIKDLAGLCLRRTHNSNGE